MEGSEDGSLLNKEQNSRAKGCVNYSDGFNGEHCIGLYTVSPKKPPAWGLADTHDVIKPIL